MRKKMFCPPFGANISHLTRCPPRLQGNKKNAKRVPPVFRGALGTNSRAKTAYPPRKGGKKEEKMGSKTMGA